MAKQSARLEQFKTLLSQPVVDLDHLRQLCFEGCPDAPGIRATCWKLLLSYLPPETDLWETTLKQNRELYKHYVKETIIIPDEDDSVDDDHPLNPNPDSSWNKYFQDNETLIQIDHDAKRLYPDISFFQLPTAYPCTQYRGTKHKLKRRVEQTVLPSQVVESTRQGVKNVRISSQSDTEPHVVLKEGQEAHWEVVERILFIHTKVHKGLGYIQGMNEICGPLYYVFASQPDKQSQEFAEADTFFCFSHIMVEIGDKFNKALDSSPTGYKSALNTMMMLLKRKDAVLYENLVSKDVDPQFFGFRWITLLLSQEFLLPDVIQIWDTFLADSKRFDFVIYVCCSMILCIKRELIAGDFGENIVLLQHYSSTNVDIRKVIVQAKELRDWYPLSICK
ncbi:TBC1 domain family member 13-like [Dysidea avara]|uniref:TBC1 domain family member 13-like n=1 Tax=Dysidea avara TaxID=196820 RepID=UPI00332B9CBD